MLSKYAPEPTNGTILNREIYGDKISLGALASSNIEYIIEDDRVAKWIRGLTTFKATNANMKATAYLLDTEAWSSFKDEEEKAEYIIGGPTLELFIASYNMNHEKKINVVIADEVLTYGSRRDWMKWSKDES